MFILQRFILLLIPAVWWGGIELVYKKPLWWWIFGVFVCAQIILTVFYIVKGKINNVFWHFLILPIAFALSSLFFSMFMVSDVFFHFVALISGLILFFLLNQCYVYFHLPFKYQPYSLESLSFYISVLAFYFFMSSIYGALILMRFDLILLTAIMIVVASLLTYYFFWISKVNFQRSWLFILIILMVLAELFIAITYLPTSYYVNSFILTVAYYLMLGFSRLFFNDNFNKKQVITFSLVGALLLIAVIFSARWS